MIFPLELFALKFMTKPLERERYSPTMQANSTPVLKNRSDTGTSAGIVQCNKYLKTFDKKLGRDMIPIRIKTFCV